MEPYYYTKMSREMKAAYQPLLAGLLRIDPEVQLPKLEPTDLYHLFFFLRLDHPELFWATGYKYKFYPDSPNLIFVPEYLFPKAKILEHQKAMRARVENLTRSAKSLSEEEKELYIHDFICKNVRYDKLKKPYSHEIIGPLGQGVGVCEGIAKSVKVLCDALNIWCVIALCDNNPDKGIKYRHTWNIVRINGKYYHLDATFDNSISSEQEIRYDYFNLDDANVFRDHEPLIWPVPPCTDGDSFYYRKRKLSFTKPEEVYKRSLQAAKKKKPLIFHWRGGYLTREMFAELLELMKQAGAERSQVPSVHVNWAQKIIRVSYLGIEEAARLAAGQGAASEVVEDIANEGETL